MGFVVRGRASVTEVVFAATLFRLRREDHRVGYEDLVAWGRWLGFERLVSCRQTWAFRGVLPVKISFLPNGVDAAFGRWR